MNLTALSSRLRQTWPSRSGSQIAVPKVVDVEGHGSIAQLHPDLRDRVGHEPVEVHGFSPGCPGRHPGELEQGLQESLHPLGSGVDSLEVLAPLLVELPRVLIGQDPRERIDRAQRSAKVVRHGVRKRLELLVRLGQPLGALGNAALESFAQLAVLVARRLEGTPRGHLLLPQAEVLCGDRSQVGRELESHDVALPVRALLFGLGVEGADHLAQDLERNRDRGLRQGAAAHQLRRLAGKGSVEVISEDHLARGDRARGRAVAQRQQRQIRHVDVQALRGREHADPVVALGVEEADEQSGRGPGAVREVPQGTVDPGEIPRCSDIPGQLGEVGHQRVGRQL